MNVAYPNFRLSARDNIFAHSRETTIDIDYLSYDPRNKDIEISFTDFSNWGLNFSAGLPAYIA